MERQPDVEIAAAVRADEVRFDHEPEIRVVAYADSPARAASVSERERLPDKLEPGVTYRNFAVRWRLTARLNDADSAYGEDGHPGSSSERPRQHHGACRPPGA